ncbi:UNVERIFIED_CONTAM: hypothetical protein FKN15_033571 [Acipenser sinensis]
MAPEPQAHAAMGLAPERERLSALGLSTAVISTIQSARAPSTSVSLRAFDGAYIDHSECESALY